MSKFVNSQKVVFSNKFENYNSTEYQVLKEVFETVPMMDTYVANIVEEYIYSTVRETDEEGNIIEYRTKYGEKDGDYKMWFANGQLSMETTYVNGKLHGFCNEFFDDGRLAIQSYYKNGKLHGDFKEWLIVIDTDKHYLSKQTTYVDGKLHGEYKFWYSTGQLAKQINYIDGKKHGEYKEWWENGKIWHKITFVNGENKSNI